MPLIDVDGHRIAYAQAGTGPAIVLLHGYVGDGEATWHPQLRDLRDDFTLVAWDAPGAGRSSDPLESLGLSGYADALALFLTGLGLTRPHLVGLSFGGILALEFCTRHPGRVQTVSLVSAYAGWAGSWARTSPTRDWSKRCACQNCRRRSSWAHYSRRCSGQAHRSR